MHDKKDKSHSEVFKKEFFFAGMEGAWVDPSARPQEQMRQKTLFFLRGILQGTSLTYCKFDLTNWLDHRVHFGSVDPTLSCH